MLTLFSFRARFTLSVLILLTILAISLQAQRLPTTVIPSHYKLHLDPDIGGQKFTGEETITVQVQQATNEIVLNSLGLEISLAEVIAGLDMPALPVQVTYDEPNEIVRLTLAKPLLKSIVGLHLKFSGKLTSGLRGLYLSKSARRQYAVTQFEGTYARMMFPGFDEPSFKATFDLSVIADKGDTAISNGRIVKDDPLPGSTRHKITFSTSPKMSTYLVALAVGDWQCLERTVDGVPIRVCAEPDKKQYGQFALEAAAQSVHFYNQWYGIKYPFQKLDMLAIPDYEWGGMENTASIFYRDTSLLLDEKTASVFSKRGHATVVAHEIAHQWFGDLVTAAWWDDIWLNEGFATWMERKPIRAWHPEWHLEDDEAATAQRVIGLDSLSAARAIHGDPRTSAEIKEMFDGITYEKGGAVLGMLESYVGPEVFRNGVNAYLKAHANGNATSADFWQAMAKVSGKPIDKIMPTFVLQPGVPLVTVDRSCSSGKQTLELSQQRFLLSPSADNAKQGQIWSIPICTKAATSSGSSCYLLDQQRARFTTSTCPDWLMANRDAKGYYRVHYPGLKSLKDIGGMAEKGLTVPERIAFIEDLWAMTRAGKEPVETFLVIVRALRADRNRLVIEFIADHMNTIGRSLVPEQKQNDFRMIVHQQFAPPAAEIGWVPSANDDDDRKALRASLLGILGSAGDPAAVATAQKITQAYIKDTGSVEGTIIGPALAVAAENGDAALYEQFTQAMAGARSTEDYYHFLFALTSFRQPELAQRTLALIDHGKIRQQDYVRLFPSLLAESPAREIAWDYLKAHWDSLADKVTSFGGSGAVSALAGFCSVEIRDDIKQFFTDHRAPGAERAVQQSLQRITSCVEFKQLQSENMQKFFQQAP
ncbi:MAG TPA: M1 family metallopeptidase [Candidatus Binatia bacterium]|nr:M1 family metallopeptidase [Candidatus Binatia bacterium]